MISQRMWGGAIAQGMPRKPTLAIAANESQAAGLEKASVEYSIMEYTPTLAAASIWLLKIPTYMGLKQVYRFD